MLGEGRGRRGRRKIDVKREIPWREGCRLRVKRPRVRLGGRGRAAVKNVGESSLESSSVISPSLPLPFARSHPPSLLEIFHASSSLNFQENIEAPMHTFEHVELPSFQLLSCT